MSGNGQLCTVTECIRHELHVRFDDQHWDADGNVIRTESSRPVGVLQARDPRKAPANDRPRHGR